MTPNDIVLSPRGVNFRAQRFPCTIGRGGFSQMKSEGDGATPVGTHQVVGMYHRADRTTAPTPWSHPIGPSDLWCDEADHAQYNQHVTAPFSGSHEVLRRADPMYDIVIVLNWNWPDAKSGAGSAIFMHAWRRRLHPTAGCIAFAPNDLRWIAERIEIGTRVIVPNLHPKRARQK